MKLRDMSGAFSPHTHEDPRDSWPECESCGAAFPPNSGTEDERVCGDCARNQKCDYCGKREYPSEMEHTRTGLRCICDACSARREDMADAARDDRLMEGK